MSGPEAVTRAASAARGFAEAQWLTDDESARLCIVVEELIANLYDHAGLDIDDEVTLFLASEEDGIRITIADRGKPFDPRTASTASERPERGGGAGIDIVRAWAVLTSYETTAEGNRLELLLPLMR